MQKISADLCKKNCKLIVDLCVFHLMNFVCAQKVLLCSKRPNLKFTKSYYEFKSLACRIELMMKKLAMTGY
jgi:hypothetical protein